MNTVFGNRIKALQDRIKEMDVDYFILSDADPHNSEYVGDYFKLRSAYSGFTGSNGTLLVGQKDAYLWTDGRYFIQAEKELEGSGITLMRMGEKGVPAINAFLADCAKEKIVVGFDGRCFMYKAGLQMQEAVSKAGKVCKFCDDSTLARNILKAELLQKADDLRRNGNVLMHDKAFDVVGKCRAMPIRVLPEILRGEDSVVRLETIRKKIKEQGCDAFLSCKLDTNMWLMNIRGDDILYNPVAFSYVYVEEDRAALFVKKEAVTDELENYANQNMIILEDYDFFADKLAEYAANKNIITDFACLNTKTFQVLQQAGATLRDGDCETAFLQSVKTEREIAHIKDVYMKDSVAVCKFLYWLSKQESGSITEYDAMCKMDALRAETEGNRGLSFNTISAFGANAAMMHYETTKEACAVIEKGNLFLLDSGGQYDGGTTDVTRTVVIGEPTEEMRKHFTMVVRGMLALQNAVFMKGCTGMNLDILARAPMWEECMDYKCGTGHGIGYMLNVHEGPQAIRVKSVGVAGKTEFLPGMIVSDEPGIYLEGKYGIRMENILLCEEVCENQDGTFLHFYPLTYVPVDMRLIDKGQMQPKEIKWLEDYQQNVYGKVAPLLTPEEARWLWEETKNEKKV